MRIALIVAMLLTSAMLTAKQSAVRQLNHTILAAVADSAQAFGRLSDGAIAELDASTGVPNLERSIAGFTEVGEMLVRSADNELWLQVRTNVIMKIDTRSMTAVDSVNVSGPIKRLRCTDDGTPLCVLMDGAVVRAPFGGQQAMIWDRDSGRCVDAAISADSVYLLLSFGEVLVLPLNGVEGRIARPSDLGVYGDLLVTRSHVILNRRAGLGSEFVVMRRSDGVVVGTLPVSDPVLRSHVLGDSTLIMLTASGSVFSGSITTGVVQQLQLDAQYWMIGPLFTSMCVTAGRVLVYGPRSTIGTSIDGSVIALRSSLQWQAKRAASISLDGSKGSPRWHLLLDISRLYVSDNRGQSWKNGQLLGDRVTGGNASRIVNLWGSVYALFSDDDNIPRMMIFDSVGRYSFSGFDVTSPLDAYQIDDRTAVVALARAVGTVTREGIVNRRRQLFFLPTTMRSVARVADHELLYGGTSPRVPGLGCESSQTQAVMCRVDVDADRVVDSVVIDALDDLMAIIQDSTGDLLLFGMGRDAACQPRPTFVRWRNGVVSRVQMSNRGNVLTAARSGRMILLGGNLGTLYASTDNGRSWTALQGWQKHPEFAGITQIVVDHDGSFVAVGGDGVDPVVLRIDTGSVTTTVVDVAPAEPGPAPIVIDAVVPNPASSSVTAMIYRDRSIPIEACILELFDMAGARVLDLTATLRNASDDTPMVVHCPLNGLANGQYLLTASVGGRRSTKVVVKQARE